MPNTYVDYTATAAQTDFNFSFDYLDSNHVEVFIDGVETSAFTIELSPKRVVLTTPATGGETIRIRRSSDPTANLVNFVDGSVLTEADLDLAYLHNRYLNEEAFEGNTSSLQTADGSTNFDANFNKIINLSPPTNSLDAANKNYVDDKLVLSGTSLSGFNKSTHTGDNATTTFTLSFTPQTGTASAFRVAIDGVLQTPDDAYTVDSGASTITFTSAPPTNAEIVVIATGTAQDVNSIGVTATGSTTARSLANRFADVVNVLDYGADNTGAVDATTAVQAAIDSGAKVIKIPTGTYVFSLSLSSTNNISFIIDDNTTLKPVSTAPVFSFTTCDYIHISGGNFTSDSRVSDYILFTDCSFCSARNVKAGFTTKSTYSAGIYYSTAAITLTNSTHCKIIECETYNMEGAGIILDGGSNNNTIDKCYIHNNITGIINNNDTTNYNTIINNRIGFNNVNGTSGADGILVNATDIDNASSGHKICNNTIYNSGEHGMYVQSANTVIESNICYSNTAAGIKIAKTRGTVVSDNVSRSNGSAGIQVQSGYENVIISGNNMTDNSTFDIDFTYNTGLDPFGGEDALIEGNYCQTSGVTWSIDASAENNLQIRDNYCANGIVTTYIGDQADVVVSNNTIKGELQLARCLNPLIIGNKLGNFSVDTQCSDVEFMNNVVEDLNHTVRKKVSLFTFSKITGNTINSTNTSSDTAAEIFNAQDTSTSDLIFSDNYIQTSGTRVISKDGSGINFNDSVISGNRFKVAGGTDSLNIDSYLGANTNLIITGNSGVVGTIEITNSIAIGNTGGATFTNDGGSQIANNL